jgi:hypothetical protein
VKSNRCHGGLRFTVLHEGIPDQVRKHHANTQIDSWRTFVFVPVGQPELTHPSDYTSPHLLALIPMNFLKVDVALRLGSALGPTPHFFDSTRGISLSA